MDAIAHLRLRQDRFLFLELRRRIVAAFDVGAAEAGEFDRLAARVQDRRFATGRVGRDLHAGAEHARVHHLRRHRALPDQLVDAQLVGIEDAFELARRQPEVGGTDRFVRFLRVLDARLVAARRAVVFGAEHLLDDAGRLVQRLVRQRRRVGPVIGDETTHRVPAVDALKQSLRDLHRALGGEAELAARLLRQRRGRERRRGTLDAGLLLDGGDRPWHVRAQRLDERGGRGLIEQPYVLVLQLARLRVEILAAGNAAVVQLGERRDEFASLAFQPGFEIPVHRGAERAALFFALDDEPHRHALHAAGAEAGLHLFPEHRREGVTVKAIENPPALLRTDEVFVDLSRVVERLAHRLFGDFVKDNAADGDLRLEHLRKVPAD